MKNLAAERRAEFSKKMTDILNYAALNLALAVGYRTGLLDVMDEINTPSTASAIAEKSGLNGRYVREWLSVMVCGKIVELTVDGSGEELFLLPSEHGDLITRRSGNSNLGVYTQEIPLLTQCAFDGVVERFSSGKGIAYENYPQFQNFMSQLADAKHRQVLVDQFLPSVDQGRLIEKMKTGIRVCDLGCAEGIALMLMAESFPESEFVGIDISGDAIQKAAAASARLKLKNIRFHNLDAATLSADQAHRETFDYVTAFDAIHDQRRPLEALKGIYSILKPGGIFSMIDIAAGSRLADNMNHSMGPFLYTVSLMHCMPVGLMEGGSGLGMMWGRQRAEKMLEEAGFETIQICEIPGDPFNDHYLCRKPR